MGEETSIARAGTGFHRLSYGLQLLYEKGAPYTTSERALIVFLLHKMSWDDQARAFNWFGRHSVIAESTGLSLHGVRDLLRRHENGPAPIVACSKPGRTRGIKHACERFTLITNISAFVGRRDADRQAKQVEADQRAARLRPRLIEVEVAHDAGRLSDADYQSQREAIEREIQGKRRPKRARKVPSAASGARAGLEAARAVLEAQRRQTTGLQPIAACTPFQCHCGAIVTEPVTNFRLNYDVQTGRQLDMHVCPKGRRVSVTDDRDIGEGGKANAAPVEASIASH